ncbi:MAG: glutamate-1-semialdehyde-2,1-aminomutase [Chlamydiae bacterium]|nr:glutamate-1-semialdehyde-2,1-aminomutase [Chlamydiota bacterium]
MRVREKSQHVYLSSCGVIPGGVNSPVRSCKEVGIDPMVVSHGKADTIWDVDGHPYVDFCMSWGALLLGHADAEVVDAVGKQMARGSSFGITTPLERDMAEKVTQLVPGMEKVRFVSSGTEAVMSAIRLARGYTGKNVIIKFNGNYHGHCDALLVQAGSGVTLMPRASSQGIPEESLKYTLSLPYNEIGVVRDVIRGCKDLAAVLIEPIAANMGVVPADETFLSMLREETQAQNALLIFDEVISGFRVGAGGAQAWYGVEADLICLGKIVGGGLPAAAFGGRSEIMNFLAPLGSVYQAGTLSGNPLAMQAGLTTLSRLQEEGFYQKLQDKANLLLLPIEQLIEDRELPLQLHRVGSMFTLFFCSKKIRSKEDLATVDLQAYQRYFQALFHEGIYMAPSQFEANFISAAHTEENLRWVRDKIMRYLVCNYAL